MTEDNRVSANLTAAQITAILTAVQAIHAAVDSFTISVSNQDRQEIPKMGAKSVGFEDKCSGTMASKSEFLSGFVDIAEVTKDRNLRAQLLQFIPQLRTLMEGLEDTLLVVNSEIWMADLAYYQSVREASSMRNVCFRRMNLQCPSCRKTCRVQNGYMNGSLSSSAVNVAMLVLGVMCGLSNIQSAQLMQKGTQQAPPSGGGVPTAPYSLAGSPRPGSR